MTTEVKVFKHEYDRKYIIMQHDTEAPCAEGRFALELIGRFGLIAGEPDGEDSAGRQKGAVMPVAEVVARACDLSRAAFDALRESGWMVKVPTIAECEELVKSKEKELA